MIRTFTRYRYIAVTATTLHPPPYLKSYSTPTGGKTGILHTALLDDHSELEPPDPIPNSEVKRLSADGSVGFPHVRVGHRQALKPRPRLLMQAGLFYCYTNLPFLLVPYFQ